jgi:hypothetical protein
MVTFIRGQGDSRENDLQESMSANNLLFSTVRRVDQHVIKYTSLHRWYSEHIPIVRPTLVSAGS